MTSLAARIKSMLLGLCVAAALSAQVDTKLLTTTDVLDVYKSGGGMPEMLTIFDFSGSMENTFWHEKYWTNLNSDFGNNMTINQITGVVSLNIGNGITARGFLVEPSGAKITTLPITAAVVRRASHARLTAALTSGSNTYTRTLDIPIPWTLFQVPAALPTAGVAPVPDYFNDPKSSPMSPTAVVFDTVYTLTDANIVNLGAAVTRTITAATYSASTVTFTTSSAQSGHGLSVGNSVLVTGITPSGYNGTFTVTAVPGSRTFRVAMASNPGTFSLASSPAATMSRGGSGQIGLFAYNADYVYWLFWGNVVKAADGNSYIATAAAGYNDDRNQAPPGGVFATGTDGIAGGFYPAGGGYVIPGVYAPGDPSTPGTTVRPDGLGTTFNNLIPAGTRSMFLKKAVLQTWLSKQDKVLWAYRFLDVNNEPGVTPTSTNFGSGQRYLTQFKTVSSGIHASVSAIQRKIPANGTPLSSALVNAYAQMVENATNGSVFDRFNTGIDPSPCRTSFVILFTDGLANTDTIGANEVAANATTARLRESDLQAVTRASLDSDNFNIFSLAAVAAHGLDNGANNGSQQTTGAGNPSAYAPFRVMNRGAEGTSGRKITTMTVGLSLAGTNTSSFSTGGKGPLLRTALYGDPANSDTPTKTAYYDLQYAVAFGKVPLTTETGLPTGRDGRATNFFDASDPNALIASLSAIIARVTAANTSISAPSAPLVGLNLGNRAFLGRFESSNQGDGSGSLWQGDLLMAGVGVDSTGSVVFKDKAGTSVTDLNVVNAVASASGALKDATRGWKNRNIYTVVPGTSIPVGGLPLTAATQAFSTGNALLTPKVMGVGTATEAASLIRFIRGASKAAQADGTTTASRGDIMGDIINSSPAAVEYDPALIPTTSRLFGLWPSYKTLNEAAFQVLFVGDNQGHFHAFGVVSGLTPAGVLQGAMDELWSFVPPEFLNQPSVSTTVPKLSMLQATGNDHLYTVDGTPFIYFKDNPLSGSATGNLRVESGETIRVIVGLRKGGRSYYAFDVADPGAPILSWMLDPNNSSDPIIKTMGLSTSTPSVALVETGSAVPVVEKPVVLLGGGYSNNDLDGLTIGNNAGPTKLGRSLLALDVETGSIVKAYDFVNNGALAAAFPNMGAISAGAFPLQFLPGSKPLIQRVYFGDQSGGVYALGSMQTFSTGPVGFRLDNSNIDQWTTDGSLNVSTTPGNAGIRWIYKGQTTINAGKVTAAAPISSTPVAYRLQTGIPQFRRPSTASNAPNRLPPVVGVAFGTGDRNDPMDLDTINSVVNAPNRQIMVFDRQDSADLPTVGGLPSNVNGLGGAITDAQLSDQTSNSTPGTTSYLGNHQYLGYFLRFHGSTPDPVSGKPLFEKSYTSSLVTRGSLFFITFRPGKAGSTAICQGAGTSYIYRMCDALAPVFANGDVQASGAADRDKAGCSGFVAAVPNLGSPLTGIASNAVSTGQDDPVPGQPISSNIRAITAPPANMVRALAPRAWRVIR